MRDDIAAEFVCDDFSWHAARFKKSLEETFCCLGVSSRLQVHVYDFAILIDGPPEVVLYASDLDLRTSAGSRGRQSVILTTVGRLAPDEPVN